MTTTKRFLEQVFQDYVNSEKDNGFNAINRDMQEIADEMGLNYTQEHSYPPNNEKIEFGKVFLFTDRESSFMFVITGEIEGTEFYECKKVSDWIWLSNQNDFITELEDTDGLLAEEGKPVIIEKWLTLYMHKEEIKHSLYIGKLKGKDEELFEKILDENMEIPREKRGLTVPEEDYRYVQNKFHKEEALKVKSYSVRIFLIMEMLENKDDGGLSP